ncbi:MAG: cytochrome c biogenesis heme-transporting ATPase CcmA [Cellvibrionaceae bacterium]|nr:cytochrome c biogenesis heme-transporting ATPase CcmA [Cellvibrionaceae bacterium]
MPSLEFRQFTCLRDGYPLFNPLNFSLQGGEVVQIAGPNGAGKTTFLRSVCGLFDEWTGEMLWQGQPLRAPDFSMCSELVYLGHQPGVKKSLTAQENLRWFFGVQGLPFPGSITSALAEVGLAGYEDTPCHQMSAGQLRRVALARLYITSAAIWILDEPFTAIDRFGVKNLETLIQRHASNGGLVILTTHQTLALSEVRVIELQAHSAEVAVDG